MKSKAIYLLILLYSIVSFSQGGFRIENNKKRVVIPFKFINNLVIIPLEINGTTLNFLLDSGVEETLLFSVEDNEGIKFSNLEKVMFRGIGSNEPFEGLRSSNNNIKVNGFNDSNHIIYIVLNQNINISSHLGVPVNGIIGYHFFKNHCISINYNKKKIFVYNDTIPISKKLKNYQRIPISIEEKKPYVNAIVSMDSYPTPIDAKLLIDIGNADALWLFKDKDERIKVPEKNFEDYLGMGFSGTVYGNRCRIKNFQINNFSFENPIVAMPDSTITNNIKMVDKRIGSIGSEIMKRFSIVFDYPNNQMYLKKNDNFKLHFNYNMSGIEIQHQGLEWVKEKVEDKNSVNAKLLFEFDGNERSTQRLNYKFVLKPSYSVFSVRKDSPSELAGIKIGDEIKKINGRDSYSFTLQEINDILKSEEDRLIVIEVLRNNQLMKFKFKLKNII